MTKLTKSGLYALIFPLTIKITILMKKITQKKSGVACLTLAFMLSTLHFLTVSYKKQPIGSFSSLPCYHTPSHQSAELPLPSSFDYRASNDVTQPRPSLPLSSAPSLKKETHQLNSGSTLLALLTGAGVSKSEAEKALAALKPIYNTKSLKAGQDINIKYLHHTDKPSELVELSFHPDLGKNVFLTLNNHGEYKATTKNTPVRKDLRKVSFKIHTSLLASASAKGIPQKTMTSLIQAFSYDLDFQRDIKKGDKFSIVFERHYDPQSGRERMGDALYAKIETSKKSVQLYRFEKDGKISFYNQNGESIRKTLMRTPINGARVNSKLGNRRHPISGYTKMHKGVDFAAPPGTKIFAAGDGVVTKAFRNKGLGNYVEIKHNKQYATGYGHLSKFAKGIKPGTKVKQGSVIGYVGQTGHATGPHLHFEVHKNGVQINPMMVANLSSGKLTGRELKSFLAAKKSIDQKMTKLSEHSQFASDISELKNS